MPLQFQLTNFMAPAAFVWLVPLPNWTAAVLFWLRAEALPLSSLPGSKGKVLFPKWPLRFREVESPANRELTMSPASRPEGTSVQLTPALLVPSPDLEDSPADVPPAATSRWSVGIPPQTSAGVAPGFSGCSEPLHISWDADERLAWLAPAEAFLDVNSKNFNGFSREG